MVVRDIKQCDTSLLDILVQAIVGREPTNERRIQKEKESSTDIRNMLIPKEIHLSQRP